VATFDVARDSGKRGWIIPLGLNTEVWGKLGHNEAGSCFPYIFPSTLWILAKFGTYRSSFQGASSITNYERFGEELAEEVGYYW